MGFTTDSLHLWKCRHKFIPALFMLPCLCLTVMTQLVTPCPSSCQCSLLPGGSVTAVCRLGNHSDYTAVTRLPSNTTELVCVVRGKLDEDVLDLKSLWRLKRLVFTPEKSTSYFKARLTDSISAIFRNNLFQNLTGLASFGLNIPTSFLTPRLLDPVPNLELLDFSHSFLSPTGALNPFMENMKLSGNRLFLLNLTAVQRSDRPNLPILLRDEIFIRIQSFPIKTLDLFDNDIVALQAGMTAYLPELELIRIGSRRLLYFHDPPQIHARACFNVELLLHPSIREFFIRFPHNLNYNAHGRARRSLPRGTESSGHLKVLQCIVEALLHPQETLCELVNCICKGLIQIPCENIQNVTVLDILDYRGGCYRNLRLPLPPQLERLSVQNIGINDNTALLDFLIPDSPEKVFKACFHPNNKLKYLDLSTAGVNDMAPFASNLSFSGLKQLEFCNLQGHGILFTPRIQFFADATMLKVLLLGGNRVDLGFWEDLDFLHMPNLESLDLEFCLIHIVPQNSFSLLQNLRYLNLSDNRIENININLSGHLRILNLSENRISSLPHTMTDNLDHIAKDHNVVLDLSQNPLRCFCDELRFVKWLKSTKAGFKNKHSTFCTHPRLSKVHPWEVNTDELYLICRGVPRS